MLAHSKHLVNGCYYIRQQDQGEFRGTHNGGIEFSTVTPWLLCHSMTTLCRSCLSSCVFPPVDFELDEDGGTHIVSPLYLLCLATLSVGLLNKYVNE